MLGQGYILLLSGVVSGVVSCRCRVPGRASVSGVGCRVGPQCRVSTGRSVARRVKVCVGLGRVVKACGLYKTKIGVRFSLFDFYRYLCMFGICLNNL